jgi:hypothetical protein
MTRCPFCLEEVHLIGDDFSGPFWAGHDPDCALYGRAPAQEA